MRADRHSQVSMRQVFSSHVHAIGYAPETSELHVWYKNGTRGRFQDVPKEKADEIMRAESIGKALHKHARGAHDFEPD